MSDNSLNFKEVADLDEAFGRIGKMLQQNIELNRASTTIVRTSDGILVKSNSFTGEFINYLSNMIIQTNNLDFAIYLDLNHKSDLSLNIYCNDNNS